MRRIAMMVAAALGLAACGGSDGNDPAVSQVTVTVRYYGTTSPGRDVVMSSGIQTHPDPLVHPTPTGVLATQPTGDDGTTTFTVPGSTTTGSLCFSSLIMVQGGYEWAASCASLNALTPTVLLDHDAT
jgi:hypothetical protein